MRYVLWLAALGCVVILSACAEDSADSGTGVPDVGQDAANGATDSNGRGTVEFAVSNGLTAFELATFYDRGTSRLVSLVGPGGEELIASTSEVGRGNGSSNPPHVTNYPFVDGNVRAGNYRAVYELEEGRQPQPVAGVELRTMILSKRDADTNNGVLRINLITAGPVADSEETRAALERALEIWRTIYERGGILLDVEWYRVEGPGTLPDPRQADPYYDQILQGVRSDSVNVVLGAGLTGLKGPYDQFGLLGTTPGAATASSRSVVVLSILALTGPDGQFDYEGTGSSEVHNNETRLAAEEMARLAARYLGLEDIVKFQGSSVIGSDSLSDTASCLSVVSCREEQGARNNLMFPVPLSKTQRPDDFEWGESGREFYPRDSITQQQRAVLNRHVLVD